MSQQRFAKPIIYLSQVLFKSLWFFAMVLALILHPVGSLKAMADAMNEPQVITSLASACKKGLDAIDIDKFAGAPFQNPEEITSNNGVLETELEVKYGDNIIAGCPVHLRSYNGKLVGPTLRVKPGDTIKINLINSLPKLPDDTDEPNRGKYNVTNFHTHGLHVSPQGNSDNVLREMVPGKSYPIQIKIPKNHPGGAYWYHAHLHHSTALQVSSGMAGALIVEAGLDQLPQIAPAEEKIFVFQQITYGEDGRVKDYSNFGPKKWQESGRKITINGQLAPTIRMSPGEVQHWRFVHAGIRETVTAQLQKKNSSQLNADIKQAAANNLIKLNEIAVDGIPLGRIDSWDAIELQPGYRSDVLVKIDEPGEYQLVDLPSRGLTGPEKDNLLAIVKVEGKNMAMKLPSNSELAAVKQKEAPQTISDEEISSSQKITFNLFCQPNQDCSGEVKQVIFDVDGTTFNDAKQRTRQLQFNKAEKWTLEIGKTPPTVPGHPFHIHVNPFQHTRKGPDGKDETIWRDTLLVVQDKPQTIRTRYTDFVGKFVLHCHILDHEDSGMMQLVQIVDSSQVSSSQKL